jgi:hypothetical protein
MRSVRTRVLDPIHGVTETSFAVGVGSVGFSQFQYVFGSSDPILDIPDIGRAGASVI